MSLASEYGKQFTWRDWDTALSLCPIKPGQHVLDLGCGIGDVARELSRRGAIVTAVDSNAELLEAAQHESASGVTFVQRDLSALNFERAQFDGLWCSFTAAYFTAFDKTFDEWKPFLKENAWVCIIDIDNLLGHEPLSAKTKEKLNAFYDEAFSSKRYDFKIGRKLPSILQSKGFKVISKNLADKELSFDGPASSDVIQAWRSRFNRMGGLKSFFKEDFVQFENEFIGALSSSSHKSTCKVVYALGVSDK